ncbi:hypothetical protein A9Q99_01865 [Gammaproteobacteria bacterium 45_16_T64]|nr:hypothetical protein A9Q99_01865 [Gammaproteobacteria bacterium 45_16_T64]
MFIFLGAALATNVAGVSILFYSWKQRHKSTVTLNVVGGCLVIMACVFWSEWAGAEYGSVYWLMISPLIAWLWVVQNRQRKLAVINAKPYASTKISIHQIWQVISTLLVAGPVACMASGSLSLVLARCLSVSEANQFVLAVFLLIIGWSLMSFWVVATARVLRALGVLIGVSVICNVLLWF